MTSSKIILTSCKSSGTISWIINNSNENRIGIVSHWKCPGYTVEMTIPIKISAVVNFAILLLGRLWNSIYNFLSSLLFRIVKKGRVPRHVAFIMDGNRRYAVKSKLNSKFEGHQIGFEALQEILADCFSLGIQAVTVYAFSLENFKRSDEEVSQLMQLAVEKAAFLANNNAMIDRYEVGIDILGEKESLSIEVQEAVKMAIEATKKFSQRSFNICFAYTSQAEQLNSSNTFLKKVSDEKYFPGLYSNFMYTAKLPPLDLVIRTSGEWRLSEFLTWQISENNSQLEFLDIFWPQLRLQHILPAMWRFQSNEKKIF